MEKLLTVLIPFKNEREELALTCKSVRDTAGDRVDIIVYNDASDPGFNYQASVEPYNVFYYEGTERLGSSLGKEKCVELCQTPYFLILDSHCRLYTENWLDIALEELQKEEDCVYCCKVQYFSNELDHMSKEHMCAYGGFWDYNLASILSCAWNLHNLSLEEPNNPPFEIPCLLGANYLCSKRWWNYLGGYNGLKLYGREETYISKKSWLCGGKVKCIPRIHTGHKTRPGNVQPYKCMAYEVVHNAMVVALVIFGESIYTRLLPLWKNMYSPKTFNNAYDLLNSHKQEVLSLHEEFKSKQKITHEELDKFNQEFQQKIEFNYKPIEEKNQKIFKTKVYRIG